MGVFTRKAIIVISHQRVVMEEFGMKFQKGRVKFIWELIEYIIRMEKRRGRDAVIV